MNKLRIPKVGDPHYSLHWDFTGGECRVVVHPPRVIVRIKKAWVILASPAKGMLETKLRIERLNFSPEAAVRRAQLELDQSIQAQRTHWHAVLKEYRKKARRRG